MSYTDAEMDKAYEEFVCRHYHGDNAVTKEFFRECWNDMTDEERSSYL